MSSLAGRKPDRPSIAPGLQHIETLDFAGWVGDRPGSVGPLPDGAISIHRGPGAEIFARTTSQPPREGSFVLRVGEPEDPKHRIDPFDVDGAGDESIVATFAGSYALCAVDPLRGLLSLARSGSGSRRVYLCGEGGCTFFASNLDWLHALRGSRPDFDPVSLFMFLEHLQIPAPFTPWAGIEQLFPGERRIHALEDGAGPALHSGLLPRLNPALQDERLTGGPLRGDEALNALDAALREAMAITVAGAEHPGVLLSAGKDSGSLLIACPPERRADLHCIIAAVEGKRDESALAVELARELGHPHSVLRVDREGLNAVVSGDLARYEFPIGDPTAAALGSVASRIGELGDRIIDGTGNDSLFGCPLSRKFRRVDRVRRIPGRRLLGRWLGDGRARIALRPRNRAFMSWDALLSGIDCPDPHLTGARWDQAIGFAPARTPIAEKTVSQTLVKEASSTYHRSEFIGRLVGRPLAYPYLGVPLTQVLMSLHASELHDGPVNKIVLRRWLERNAPPSIAHKPKGFFSVPVRGVLEARVDALARWQREPAQLAICQVGVPATVVSAVLEQWSHGNRGREKAVWGIVVLEEWVRAHL